ncbi:MAG: helix-turn-helix domain-containing protein [Janthinobacterium lividum]
MTSDALKVLISHPWRGNVRELENIMHRATLLASGEAIDQDVIRLSGIKIQATVPQVETNANAPLNENFVGRTVADMEKDLIVGTLNHCLGNRTQAAHILGISIRTLRNKLHQYNETTNKTDYQVAG